jgi:hypothetical protein
VSTTKRLTFLYLVAFTMLVFILGNDAGRWTYGSVDNDRLIGVLIHASVALVFGWMLVRQIHKLKDN